MVEVCSESLKLEELCVTRLVMRQVVRRTLVGRPDISGHRGPPVVCSTDPACDPGQEAATSRETPVVES